jgi:hypothetical protein
MINGGGDGVVERRRKKDKGRVCVICMVKVEECPRKGTEEGCERSEWKVVVCFELFSLFI